jgi:CheY-like chemotaxis protein
LENKTKTILLVEDDAVVAVLETPLLKKEGYNIINAGMVNWQYLSSGPTQRK